MKSHITKAFGVYNTDGRGYNTTLIKIFPIEAAAEAFRAKDGYKNVSGVKVLCVEDDKYILERELSAKSFSDIKNLKALVPTHVFKNYIYKDGFDSSKYICNEAKVGEYVRKEKSVNLVCIVVIRDLDDKIFELVDENKVEIEKIVMSRELAINHALSKLTDEEKKLLGLT